MSRLYTILIAASVLGCTSDLALAQTYNAGALKIEQPWTRATPGGAKVAAGYMKITNTGAEPDRLVGGALSQAGRFEVHEMKMENGVMQMREIAGGLEIAPGQTVELKPGGYHVMFMELREPLKEGDTLKGQLRFQKAGALNVEYRVQSLGAQNAPQH